MRYTENKLVFMGFLGLLLFSNQGCQSQSKSNVDFNQTARNYHARQLLQQDYATSVAKEFETDRKFIKYLEKYINQENANLDSEDLSHDLLKVSRDFSYDPVFLLAVMKTESQFNPHAVGSAGEIGLMQIKPDTAAWICLKKKVAWKGAAALKDPSYNMMIGALYFSYLKKSLPAKTSLYINAYNMGINNLQRLPAENRMKHPYYNRVLSNYLVIYQQLKKIRKTI